MIWGLRLQLEMCGSVALPSSADISRVQPWVSSPDLRCPDWFFPPLLVCVVGELALWEIVWLDEQRNKWRGVGREGRLVSVSLFCRLGRERCTGAVLSAGKRERIDPCHLGSRRVPLQWDQV